MRRAAISLLALAAIACEDKATPAAPERPAEVATSPPAEAEEARKEPIEEGLPPVPGLLLEKLAIDREGSFALVEGSDELTPHAAVVLGEGVAFVGEARAEQSWRWVGLAANDGSTRANKLDAGSIHAAIGDGKGGALLVGSAADGSAWFGVLDDHGELSSSIVLDGDEPVDLVAVLAGHDRGEQALLVDGGGWVMSLDARGAVRWRGRAGTGETPILSGVRVPGERGEVLAVGSGAWWGRLTSAAGAELELEQGQFEIEGADSIRSLDAIVTLDHDMGFIALGRAKREAVQEHDQVLAVGFDRAGHPTWARVLEHFRATEIYGGAVHHDLRGVAHFVARVPVDSEGQSALAWIEICPGIDGVVVTRQLAGTVGWESVGFVDGRDDGAISTYRRTDAGLEWRVLLISTDHVWG